MQCDGRSPSPFSLGLLNLFLRRVVSEEVLAGTEMPGAGDDEVLLNVLRCQLTY